VQKYVYYTLLLLYLHDCQEPPDNRIENKNWGIIEEVIVVSLDEKKKHPCRIKNIYKYTKYIHNS